MKKNCNISELDARRINKKIQETRQKWSDLDDMYTAISEGILEVGLSVNVQVNLAKSLPIQNPDELAIIVKGVSNDLEIFSKDLVKINARHSGKTGVITNEDDLALCFSIFEDYQKLYEAFTNVTLNPLLSITEMITEASLANKEVTIEGEATEVKQDD